MTAEHTPRLPLTDLKQLGRPCSIPSAKPRSLISSHTPNSKKTNRFTSFIAVLSFPKQAQVFICLQYKSVENTVGKGEIAHK